MSFLAPSSSRQIGTLGDIDAKICIIGEVPGQYELNTGKPFSGPSGSVLDQCLHSAGLIRSDVYITMVVKERGSITEYYNERTKRLTAKGEEAAERLKEELSHVEANIFIPMGNLAMACLLGVGGITSRHGYIQESSRIPGMKVLPTIHPAAAIRGNYMYRHFITTDLIKARYNCDSSDITFPEVEVNIPRTFEQARLMIKEYFTAPIISIDIEVYNYEVSCIGFCKEPNVAFVLPFYYVPSLWTEIEEVYLWQDVARIMADEEIAKIGQNFIFDMHFLVTRNRIITKGRIEDTMIKSAMAFPDFPKSLSFLVGAHCNRPYWKDMVHWKGSDINKKDS